MATVRHPLLDTHPLFRPLAADLRQTPGIAAPDDGNPARAAVAIVLRAAGVRHAGAAAPGHESQIASHEAPGVEVLLIQRAERHGDPWSGQVALPGGRRDPRDATLQETAVRETREETGVDLDQGLILGTLDELRPRTPVLPPIIVTPFVAIAPPDATLRPSEEVAEAFWWPWSAFEDPEAATESIVRVRGDDWTVSSYVLGHRVVWGMTERMLRHLALRLRSLAA